MNDTAARSIATIKDEIRVEAEAMHARTPHPTLPKAHARPKRRADDERQRLDFTIAELCRFPYTTFVDQAFRSILKRPPDPAGFEAHVRLLGSGASKIEVLGNLRYSPEGRAIGARIKGLLPRYALAKLYRIPVLGYALQWIVALAGLPHIVQQQRAIDTAHFARSFDIDAAGRKLSLEVGELREAGDRLNENVFSAIARIEALRLVEQQTLRGELDQLVAKAQEPHLALSMNHWLAELRNNLVRLEAEEEAQRMKARNLLARAIVRRTIADVARGARLAACMQLLAARIGPRSRVLDLGSGEDWVLRLAEARFEAATIDATPAPGRRDAAVVVPGMPATQLERCADGALDALTALACGSLLRQLPAASLFEAARRVLKPGAVLMLAFDVDAAQLADRLAGIPSPAVDHELLAEALDAAGFIDIVHARTHDDARCLLARNPHPNVSRA